MLAAMSDTKFYNPKQELSEADRIAVNNGGGTAPPTAAPMVGGIAVPAFVQIRK
jgi:hypothetical protein